MADTKRLICPGNDLLEAGDGRRFTLDDTQGRGQEAFVVRFEGKPFAYLNRCAHVPVELDWNPGRFFDDSGLYLICATHGALYEPSSGVCVAGPCAGRSLQALQVAELDGNIYLLQDHE